MSNIFDGFLDNLADGILNPKGNLGDFRHASRTFVKNQFRLAPKVKFLYHVYFKFNQGTINKILPTWKDRHSLENGLMVKSVTLPAFTVAMETKKKYNRTKHIQTGITYDPVNMTFHDDNLGMMTGMLEAYFKYYYVDGWGEGIKNFYNKKMNKNFAVGPNATEKDDSVAGQYLLGDNTYKGNVANQTLHGLNTRPNNPFFESIEINQLTRKTFTKFTLVNPTISSWGYGDMNYAAASEPNELNVTFNYETVWISRGAVVAGQYQTDNEPIGFGDRTHYDVTPSPLNIMGGGSVNILTNITAAADIISGLTNGMGEESGVVQNDLFDYSGKTPAFNPIGAIIGGINIFQNMGQITEAGVVEELGGLINEGLEGLYDNVVNGNGIFGDDDE